MSNPNETFSLHIKQSDGKKHTVTATSSQTVLQLKEEVSKVSEVPVERQRLIFAGKVLKDEDTLASYNLKNELTIHLVRSNPGAKAAASSATTATPTPAAAQNTVTPATTVDNPLANPFAALGGGGAGGMFGGGQLPSNLQSTLLNDPNYMNMVSGLMSNPEVVREMVQSNPQLQALGMTPEQISGMVSMMNNPQMREMLANPQMREMMASMGGGMGGGMGANPFGAMGGAGGAPFGAGATPGEGAPSGMPNLAALMSQFAGAGGAGGTGGTGGTGGVAAQPAANLPPPEERFQVQLQQLNDMGLHDATKNIRALLATGGNVHAAVEYLFSNTD